MQSAGFARIPLPIGYFDLTEMLDDSVRLACGATDRNADEAHPVFGFVAALGGAGLKIADILALCGCEIDSGPLLASCDLELPCALKVSRTYQVRCEVAHLERKPSRRFGEANHVGLRFDLSSGGADHGTLRLRIVVPVR